MTMTNRGIDRWIEHGATNRIIGRAPLADVVVVDVFVGNREGWLPNASASVAISMIFIRLPLMRSRMWRLIEFSAPSLYNRSRQRPIRFDGLPKANCLPALCGTQKLQKPCVCRFDIRIVTLQ